MEMTEIAAKLFEDSIDMDAVLETVRDSNVRSYRNLYDIQKSIMGIQRIDIPLQEFTKIKRLPREQQSLYYPIRYIHTLGLDIVVGEKEFKFKTSDLMNVPLSQMDISNNATLFKNNFIAYLDGKMISTLDFLVTESECSVIINIDSGTKPTEYRTGINRERFEELYSENAILHLFVVPNYKMEVADINKPTLEMESGSVKKNKFSGQGNFKNGSSLAFMNVDTDNSMMNFIQVELLDNSITVPQETYQTDIIKRRIYMITFSNLYDIRPITTDNEWFMLSSDYELPLPTSNILIFTKSDIGYEFDPDIYLDSYYPNIYHVNHIGDKEVYLFIFYADNTLDSRYVNDLKLVSAAYDNVLEKYKDNTIPEIIRDYEPIRIDLFDREDFVNSVFFPDARNLYNISRLQEYINQDPKLLVKYLYLKLNATSKYCIDVSKIDLPERIRLDTKLECDPYGDIIYFEEPMYLFNIRKQFVGKEDMDFRLFIDNLCIRPSHYTISNNNDFYLFYIPVKMISDSSIIEIEKYDQIKFSESFDVVRSVVPLGEESELYQVLEKFPSETQPIRIDIPEYITKLDSYYIDIVDEDSMFLDGSLYKIITYNDVLEDFIEVSGYGHHVLTDHFYIILDKNLLDKTLKLIVDNSTTYVDFDFETTESTKYQSFISTGRVRTENVRIFKNGLSLPSSRFFVSENTMSGSAADIAVSSECTVNDSLAIDIIPIQLQPEYYQKTIDEHGYVDTGSELTSPFDLKWYDVYLNGKKLNKHNIEVISSNRFFIKNVDSLKNLYIMKRAGIHDAFSADYDADINNQLMDNIEGLLDNLKNDKDIIQDTAEDIVADAISDIFTHLMFISKYLEFIHIDPNKKQLSSIVKSEFPELFDEYDILTLTTNDIPDAEETTSINSNIRRQYMKKGQYRYSFTPLHIGNHSDAKNGEYMCDPITGSPGMKTESGEIISAGFLTRLANHKDKFSTKLAFNGMTAVSIYQIEMNDNTRTVDVRPDTNILDEAVVFESPVDRMMVSIDMDILEKGAEDVMMLSQYDPTVILEYQKSNNGTVEEIQKPLSALNETILHVDGYDVSIQSIKLRLDGTVPQTLKCILHSILVAF